MNTQPDTQVEVGRRAQCRGRRAGAAWPPLVYGVGTRDAIQRLVAVS